MADNRRQNWSRLPRPHAQIRLAELHGALAESNPRHAQRIDMMRTLLANFEEGQTEFPTPPLVAWLWPHDPRATSKFKEMQRVVATVSGDSPRVPARIGRSDANGTWWVEGIDPEDEDLRRLSDIMSGADRRRSGETPDPAPARAELVYGESGVLRVCVDWHPADARNARGFYELLQSALTSTVDEVHLITTDPNVAGSAPNGRSARRFRRNQVEAAEVLVALVTDTYAADPDNGLDVAAAAGTAAVPVALDELSGVATDRWAIIHHTDRNENLRSLRGMRQANREEFAVAVAARVRALAAEGRRTTPTEGGAAGDRLDRDVSDRAQSDRESEIRDTDFRSLLQTTGKVIVDSYGNLSVPRAPGEGGAATRLHRELRGDADEPSLIGVPVLDTLDKWARAPLATPADIAAAKERAARRRSGEEVEPAEYRASPYFVILGEYGMGKTTSCEELSFRLYAARDDGDTSAPQPIYLDLRRVGRLERHEIKLATIIDRVVHDAWHHPDRPPPTAATVLDQVRNRGAVLIFDGLDEVMVHLDDVDARAFARQLWSALPPSLLVGDGAAGRVGRVILSCRTHFFRDATAQNGYLLGDHREHLGEYFYESLHLLPFGERQVKAYFEAVLGDAQPLSARRAFELLGEVHNLSDLASRPRNLELITAQLHEIEALRRRGQPVVATTIYGLLVDKWLSFDAPKHQIDVRLKPRLMEALAAHMWTRGATSLDVDELEDWIVEQLDDGLLARWWRVIAGRPNAPTLDQILEDVRDASFIVRPGDSAFEFAHTSLMEYFVARWLFSELLEGRASTAWGIRPSEETVGFLVELCAEPDQHHAVISALSTIKAKYVRGASEVAFRVALGVCRANDTVQPGTWLSNWNLPGADLAKIEISAPRGGRWAMAGCDFGGARLSGASFRRIDLSGCRFERARLGAAEFVECWLDAQPTDRSEGRGVRWFGSCVGRQREQRPLGRESHGGPTGPGWSVPAQPLHGPWSLERLRVPQKRNASLSAGRAPNSMVTSVVFNHDASRVASASHDHTVRIWDPVTGEQLTQLDGHTNSVYSVVFNHDSSRVASASHDKTVRIWDPVTGEQLTRLDGHTHSVNSVVFNHDSSRVASASHDHTVRIWDPVTGEQLTQLDGHTRSVTSVVFNHDASRVASASHDHTVRIWDPVTGEQLTQLDGHTLPVNSVVFNHDSSRVASASWDETVRIWDPVTGEQLTQLDGHTNAVNSVVFNHDSSRVASASHDHTVRIWIRSPVNNSPNSTATPSR
jgi:hypothetical protein